VRAILNWVTTDYCTTWLVTPAMLILYTVEDLRVPPHSPILNRRSGDLVRPFL
jgi:hypothetical protein